MFFVLSRAAHPVMSAPQPIEIQDFTYPL